MATAHSHEQHGSAAHGYRALMLNIIPGLVIMYFVMFAMIDTTDEFYNNLNMFYMALMMAAPMGPLMILTMPGMYPRTGLNITLHVAFVLVFLAAFYGIRAQTAIGDMQFVRSMIPHHSGAVLMCREANLADPELKALCERIITSQRDEISQMKQILQRL